MKAQRKKDSVLSDGRLIMPVRGENRWHINEDRNRWTAGPPVKLVRHGALAFSRLQHLIGLDRGGPFSPVLASGVMDMS